MVFQIHGAPSAIKIIWLALMTPVLSRYILINCLNLFKPVMVPSQQGSSCLVSLQRVHELALFYIEKN
jgi:hypothetical protein